ncbi:cupredoxin domain-containing protein [Patescibacteria group bacterium]|nr:cupredoxin domain-containing protein [Patescibacteria group bacterium]
MKFTRIISTCAVTLSVLGSSIVPLVSHAATRSAFNSGDLIKGSGSTVYYFAANGKRFVFPNEKTYFTWFTNFDGVREITDGQLASIPLGGNVTYRPGRKMIKITTDPKVYVVDQGGVLRHVGSEQLAATLYGLSWKNQIDDVPDGFFVNYRSGTAIQTASDYQPANVMTQTASINQDKQFDETKITITIGSVNNSFVPTTTTVKRGTQVTWTNRDIMAHTVTGSGWQSGAIPPGQTYTRTFATAGSFDYHCDYHTVMQGTVQVVN